MFGLSLSVYIIVYNQFKSIIMELKGGSDMNNKLYTFFYWLGRILSLAILIILLMFSFDVFEIEDTFINLAFGFLIHNIPMLILLISIIVGWKKEWIPSITFFLASMFLLILLWVNKGFLYTRFVLPIVIPGIIISILYFISWKYKNKQSTR